MKWDVIAKAAGGGMTAEIVLGPYLGEPPEDLLDAVRVALTDRWFKDWTGGELETVVVTKAPSQFGGAEVRLSG